MNCKHKYTVIIYDQFSRLKGEFCQDCGSKIKKNVVKNKQILKIKKGVK